MRGHFFLYEVKKKFSEKVIKEWDKNGNEISLEKLENLNVYMEIYLGNSVKKAKLLKFSYNLYEADDLYEFNK